MTWLRNLMRDVRRRVNLWRFSGQRFSDKQKIDVSNRAKTRL